jgi:hypothetical protein
MGENQAHGASGENNKTSQDESTEPSMSKVIKVFVFNEY